ncbi:MAG: GAF domain-containing protein [Prolixibacteraceae bacterium]|jgi:L-methionine (R)-S-oxide reductase|nr:GAF domain-containing protein [Prolixibacteraceae bacterium]
MNTENILALVDALLAIKKPVNSVLLEICKLLKKEVYHYDWVGFYILNHAENNLELGPYVGKPTEHTHIAVGKGVCGQVAASGRTMIVQDVSQMDNYIACSIDVQSEIVVPVLKEGKFVAEIDIDSHSPAPFTNNDKELLEAIAEKIAYLF